MATNVYDLILYFTIYSVGGWICESIWCSVGTGKPVNRGFLNGPYCPIYGFGALLILLTCVPLKANPLLVFIVAMVAASVLEYFTGWLLETLFHQRWWDYSKRKFNLKGRVCLRNSILFGLMGIAVTYLLYPPVERLIQLLTSTQQRILALGCVVIFAVDLAHTLFTLLGLKKRLKALRSYAEELGRLNEEHSWFDARDLHGSIARLRTISAEDPSDSAARTILEKLDGLTTRRQQNMRLLKAFPNLSDKDFGAELQALRTRWQEEIDQRKQARRERKAKTKQTDD